MERRESEFVRLGREHPGRFQRDLEREYWKGHVTPYMRYAAMWEDGWDWWMKHKNDERSAA